MINCEAEGHSVLDCERHSSQDGLQKWALSHGQKLALAEPVSL